jgi:hypothetical protein
MTLARAGRLGRRADRRAGANNARQLQGGETVLTGLLDRSALYSVLRPVPFLIRLIMNRAIVLIDTSKEK